MTRDLVESARNCLNLIQSALVENHGSGHSVDENGLHRVLSAPWSHDEARHVKTPVKVAHVVMRAEEAVDAIRQLFVFDQGRYEPRPDHEIAKNLAVPWSTAYSVVIDSVEPSDGNR